MTKSGRQTKKDMGSLVIHLLKSYPSEWSFDDYHARHGRHIDIWIDNRPYADLTINRIRIGTRWQRRQIRKLMDQVRLERIIGIYTSTEAVAR